MIRFVAVFMPVAMDWTPGHGSPRTGEGMGALNCDNLQAGFLGKLELW